MSHPEDKPCDCPMRQLGIQFPYPLLIFFRPFHEEPQKWKQAPSGRVVPYWVEDEVKKQC